NVNTLNQGAFEHAFSTSLYVYNSIIATNTGGSDLKVAGGSSVILANCITTYNGTYDSSLPLFNDAANGDYSLATNSQAIEAGSNSYVTASMTTDIAGANRIQGNVVDIGAYESTPALGEGATTSILDEIFAEYFDEEPFDEF
ncbi:MAG: hypothetical protein IJL92_03500, partial [Thermoguttaceae bacterium]|nr:hypothetical protein [Thermoguttaceae bacterium]